jgi:hypothetical protein
MVDGKDAMIEEAEKKVKKIEEYQQDSSPWMTKAFVQ